MRPPRRSTGGGTGRAADRAGALGAQRPPPPRRGLLLRRERDQRPPDLGGGPGAQRGGGEEQGTPGASPERPLPGPIPLVISAKTEPALREAAANLRSHLQANPELDPTDVAYSLITSRSAFEQRAVAVSAEREGLLDALEAIAGAKPSPDAFAGTAQSGRLAYLFTGQGAQQAGMGRELYEAYPAYAAAFEEACEQLSPQLGEDLKEIVLAPGKQAKERLDHTSFAQPALFATEVALFRLLQSLGLTPDLLLGHSIGELCAAHLAGVLSLPDAAKLVAARGKLMGELPKGGAMVAVEATEQEAQELLQGKEAQISLAAINGPSSIVLSGSAEAIEEAQALWQDKGRKTKRLAVSHAFHSPLIEPMLEPFAKVAAELDYQEPQIPIVSNLSGELLGKEQATDPAYWVSHARAPVRFMDAVKSAQEQGATAFVELGPGGVLTAMAQECLAAAERPPALVPTLRQGTAEPTALTQALARAHAAGAKLDWGAFFAATKAKRVPLPTYPFQRKRYWLAASPNADVGQAGLADPGHPLLGAAIEDPRSGALTLSGRLSTQTHPWLADHAVLETILFPGSGFVELALRAGAQVGAETIAELTLQAPLLLPEQGAVQIQVTVAAPGEEGEREISIHSRPEAGPEEEAHEWACHAQGTLAPKAPGPPEPFEAWPPQGAEPIEAQGLYDRLAGLGLEYGPAFQGLSAAWRRGEELFAEVSLAPEQRQQAERFAIHPALLDAALHTATLAGLDAEAEPAPMLPFSWSGVALEAMGADGLGSGSAPGERGRSPSHSPMRAAQRSPRSTPWRCARSRPSSCRHRGAAPRACWESSGWRPLLPDRRSPPKTAQRQSRRSSARQGSRAWEPSATPISPPCGRRSRTARTSPRPCFAASGQLPAEGAGAAERSPRLGPERPGAGPGLARRRAPGRLAPCPPGR